MNGHTHLDQEIIRLMDANREQGYLSIDIKTGTVVLSGKRVNFGTKSLLDDKLKMILPTDFQSIPPEKAYKPEARPDLLFIDDSGAVQIAITHTQNKADNDDDVKTYQGEVREILQALNSSLEWQEDGVMEVRGKRIAYFEFITSIMGMRIYDLSFFLELQRRVLTGNFVYTEQKRKAWKPIFCQMLDSIEVIAKDNGDTTITRRDFSCYHFKPGLYLVHHGCEYLSFKTGEDEYRLISTDSKDLENGFVLKDGVFKKTVGKREIEAGYKLKLIVTYQGYQFEMGQQFIKEMQLVAKNCDPYIRAKLQLQMVSTGEYGKWVDKKDIENIEPQRSPVEGFVMPEGV
jgi:hypothetical protein